MVLYEAETPEARATFAEFVAGVLGWKPTVVVRVRRATDLGRVVAEELAAALDGAVYCDVDNVVFFDASGRATPAESLEVLEVRLKDAVKKPKRFFARWAKEEKARRDDEQKNDPNLRGANDWSDV